MATDWSTFSFTGPKATVTAPPVNNWDNFTFTGPAPISEDEANRTFTPEEQAMIDRANQPEFGAGLKARMAEYPQGMPLDQASAKYIAGQKQALSNIYNTVTDPAKLASVAGSAIKAGASAVAHLPDTAKRIENYYIENPDAAVTDLAFAAFPGRQAGNAVVKAAGRLPSTAMPRTAVREGDELLKTGGARIEEAKQNPAKVGVDYVKGPLQEFRDATATTVITDPTVKNIAKRLEKAYTPKKPDAMSKITKVQPPERPPLTLTELHGHQQRLDDVMNGPGKNPDGRFNEQGRAAKLLKQSITKIIDEHPESSTFKIGKNEYHRGKMNQAMADLAERAKARRQWANGDEAGAIQAEIDLFLKNKRNKYALTPEVRRKLTMLSKDTKGKLVGAFGAKNIGGFTFARAAEAAVGMPGIMALPGHFARQERNARIMKEFEDLMAEIRAGGPVR